MTIIEIYNEVDALKVSLDKLKPLKAEDEARLWKKFRLEWNFNSNHLEGNTLSYGHTELLLIFDRVSGDYTGREIEEMKAHDVAIKMIVELASDKERDLTENFIRQLNEILLVRPFWKEAKTIDGQETRRLISPGQYKSHPNSVLLENGEIFNYASPEETGPMMKDLKDFYDIHIVSPEIHPLWLASIIHYKFVRIHPFDDGNGRVARLLMNFVLLKMKFPPVVIKSEDKRAYLTALNKADTGDLESFVLYIGSQLRWSLEKSIAAAEGKNIDDKDDFDKDLQLLRNELGKEDKIKSKINSYVVSEAIENNIIPIFIQIEEKCGKIKDFFLDSDRKIEFEIDKENGKFTLGSKDSQWEILKKNWLDNKIKAENKTVKKIIYHYQLQGFKKSVSGNSIWIAIEIIFNEFNYLINTELNGNSNIQIPYETIFGIKEIDEFVSPIMKDVVERMRKLSGS